MNLINNTNFSSLTDILICPQCINQFSADSLFICKNCNRKYAIDNNIPLMFIYNDWETNKKDVTEIVKQFYEKTPFPDESSR
jgi:uncharacterized protein YbaR (Trm112 family)